MTRKIDAMHAYYGRKAGYRCADCKHLVGKTYQRSYHKCLAYGDSNSEATDWTMKWTACGLWNAELPKGHVPLVRRLRPDRTREVPNERQISMFGGET